MCIISFPTFVQTYEKWDGWDSPLCLFFIRKQPKPNLSRAPWLAVTEWVYVYLSQMYQIKEAEHLYDTANLKTAQETLICSF